MRNVLAVIGGYLALFVFMMLTFGGLYAVLQADGAFEAGSYSPSATWIAATFALGTVAAVIGGYVCRAIGKTSGPVTALIGVVIVLGAITVVLQAVAPPPDPDSLARAGDVGWQEAMSRARQPLWVAMVNPIVGAIGVFIGGRLRGDS